MATFFQRMARSWLNPLLPRRNKHVASPDDALLDRLEGVTFQPVFILGEARSGTTILYDLLYMTGRFNIVTFYHLLRHSDLLHSHINGSTAAAQQEVDQLLLDRGIVNRGIDEIPARSDSPMEYIYLLLKQTGCGYVTEENAEFFEQFCKKVQLTGQAGRPLLLKNIADGRNFKTLNKVFPNAKFIFIHREPIDILTSQLRAICGPGNTLLEVLSEEFRRFVQSRRYKLLLWLAKPRWGISWPLFVLRKRMERFERLYVRDLKFLDEKDWISLRYEDLCQDPNGELTRILKFLELDVPADLDLSSKVSPRKMKPLPEVERCRARLEERFRERRLRHGYITE